MNYSQLANGALDHIENGPDFPGYHVKRLVRMKMQLGALEAGEMLDTLKLDRALTNALKDWCVADKVGSEWRHYPKHSVEIAAVEDTSDSLRVHVKAIRDGGYDHADLRMEARKIMVDEGVNYAVAESRARQRRN